MKTIKKMRIYNRLTNNFENLENQEFYLAIIVDELRDDKAEVVTLIDTKTSSELPLNSEDNFDTIQAVELFKAEDKRFAIYVDFFRNDNPNILKEILN
jgi:hypothetical protein